MLTSLGPALLVLGIVLLIGAQLAISLHAFTGNPLQGVLCFIVPLYVYVYARKNAAGVWLMRAWYLGMGLLVAGGVLSS